MTRFTRALILTIATLVPLLPASGETSAKPSPAERTELLRVREKVWRAWFANDVGALDVLLPADTLAINAGEEAWQGRSEVLASARAFSGSGGKLVRLDFPRTEIQILGDVAVLYSAFEFETAGGQGDSKSSGRATEVFVRRDRRWVNVGWHMDSGK